MRSAKEVWRRINRPHGRLRLDEQLRGGLRLSRRFSGTLATETLLVAGLNDDEAHVDDLGRYLEALGPDVAYLSVPTRPPAEAWVRPPGDGAVFRAWQSLATRLPGTRVELLIGDEGNAFATTGDPRADLLAITAVHPMREDAVADLLARAGRRVAGHGGARGEWLARQARARRADVLHAALRAAGVTGNRRRDAEEGVMRSECRPARAAVAPILLAVLALVAVGCSRSGETPKPRRRSPRKVFLVGFDGMDPTLVRRWMAEGKLPNLSQLAREGTFSPLQTTQPSESPTAWASFATGVNPGKHNIFDFLVRDFETYAPDLAHGPEGAAEVPLRATSHGEAADPLHPRRHLVLGRTRGGTAFVRGSDRPVTFPLEEVHHSDLLAGFPLPDIRGTVGTF